MARRGVIGDLLGAQAAARQIGAGHFGGVDNPRIFVLADGRIVRFGERLRGRRHAVADELDVAHHAARVLVHLPTRHGRHHTALGPGILTRRPGPVGGQQRLVAAVVKRGRRITAALLIGSAARRPQQVVDQPAGVPTDGRIVGTAGGGFGGNRAAVEGRAVAFGRSNQVLNPFGLQRHRVEIARAPCDHPDKGALRVRVHRGGVADRHQVRGRCPQAQQQLGRQGGVGVIAKRNAAGVARHLPGAARIQHTAAGNRHPGAGGLHFELVAGNRHG